MTPNGPRFTVRGAGHFPLQLDHLIVVAEQRNLRPLFIDTLRDIAENLKSRPHEWGDPYKNYRGMKVVGYGRTVVPSGLRIEYTVHETEPLVWITSMRPLPGSPFA